MLYRARLRWDQYVQGVRERYKLLMTPAHRGFFVPWLAYVIFVAVTFRWETDVLLLAALALRRCHTPSIVRLDGEAMYLPIAMAFAIGIMMISLIPVQKGYLRVVPVWIVEALVTLAPISLALTALGLAFYWADLNAACG